VLRLVGGSSVDGVGTELVWMAKSKRLPRRFADSRQKMQERTTEKIAKAD